MRVLLLICTLLLADAIRPGYVVPADIRALVWLLIWFFGAADLIGLIREVRRRDP